MAALRINSVALTTVIVLASCGGDGSSFSSTDPAEIIEVRATPRTIPLGTKASIEVAFIPALFTPADTQLDDDSPSTSTAEFDLVVRLPPGLDYVVGSSKVTDSFLGDVIFGNPDPRGPNSVEICADKSRALLYHFSDDELSTVSLVSSKIRLEAQAYELTGARDVDASASFSIAVPCGAEPDKSVSVSLVS